MFDTDSLLRQAVSAFSPSDAVFSRVKDRICGKARKTQSSVVLVYVDKDSRKIFERVFKKYDKLMQKIA